MPGKKPQQEGLSKAIANFFGDDADEWLSEPEETASSRLNTQDSADEPVEAAAEAPEGWAEAGVLPDVISRAIAELEAERAAGEGEIQDDVTAQLAHLLLDAGVGPGRVLGLTREQLAIAGGHRSVELWRMHARVAAASGAWSDALDAFQRLAELLGGSARHAAQHMAARIALRQLADPGTTLQIIARIEDGLLLEDLILKLQSVEAMKDASALEEVLDECLDASSGVEAARHALRLSELQRADGRSEQAAQTLRRGLAADPDNLDLHVRLVAMLQDLGEHTELAQVHEQMAAQAQGPDSRFWALQAARAHRAAGDHAQAENWYRVAVAGGDMPTRREFHGWLAQRQDLEGLAQALWDDMQSDAGVKGRELSALWRLWVIQASEGRGPVFREELARTVSAGFGAALWMIDAIEGADVVLASARECLAAHPDDHSALEFVVGAAEVLEASQDDPRPSEALFAEVVQRHPEHRRALAGLVRLRRRMGDSDGARQALEELAMLEGRPLRQAQLLFDAATLEDGAVSPDRIRLANLALQAWPGHWSARATLIQAASEAGDWRRVIELLSGGAREADDAAESALYLYRAALHEVHRFDATPVAISMLEQALETDPSCLPAAWTLRHLTGRPLPGAVLGDQESLRVVFTAPHQLDLDAEGSDGFRAFVAAAHGQPIPASTGGQEQDGAEPPTGGGVARALRLLLDDRLADAGSTLLAADEPGLQVEGARLLVSAGLNDAATLELLTTHADHPKAALLLAQLVSQDEHALLARVHGRIAVDYHGHRRLTQALRSVTHHLDAGELSEAIEAFLPVVDKAPSDWQVQNVALRLVELTTPDQAARFVTGLDSLTRGLVYQRWHEAHPELVAAQLQETSDLTVLESLVLEEALQLIGAHERLGRLWDHRRQLVLAPSTRERLTGSLHELYREHLSGSEQAWEHYRSLADAGSDDVAVLQTVLEMARRREEWDLAAGYLQRMADAATSPEEALELHRASASLYKDQGMLDQAREALNRALDMAPDHLDTLKALAALNAESGDVEGQLTVLRRQVEIAPDGERAGLLREAAELVQAHHGDDLALVGDAWRAVVSESPSDVQALSALVDVAQARGDWPMFDEYAAKLTVFLKGPALASLYLRRGQEAQRHGLADAARGFLEKATETDAPDPSALVELESFFRQGNDWKGVVRMLCLRADHAGGSDEARRLYKEAAMIRLELLHDFEGTAEIHEKVRALDPKDADALAFLTRFYFESDRHIDGLEVAAVLEPQLPSADETEDFDDRIELSSFFFRMAEMLRLRNEHEGALARFERALEYNSNHLPSLEAIAPLYVAKEQWKNAEVTLRRILQLTGGRGESYRVAHTYTMLGVVEQHLGQMDKSYRRFHKALEALPNYVPAFKGLANFLEARQEWNSLLSVFNNIIYYATAPSDVVNAYLTKARILDRELHRLDKAAEHYERSLSFDAEQALPYLRLVDLHYRQRDFGRIITRAQDGLGRKDLSDDDRASLLFSLGAAHHLLGENEAAGPLLQEAHTLAPDTIPASLPDDEEQIGSILHDRIWGS